MKQIFTALGKQAAKHAPQAAERILTNVAVGLVGHASDRIQQWINKRMDEKQGARYGKEQGGKAATNSRNNRSRGVGAEGTHTEGDVWRIFLLQGRRCYYCRRSISPVSGFHVDHKTPLSRGGSNAPGNLAVTCPRCNLIKGAKDAEEFGVWRTNSHI